jgi:hypothetical protein
LISISKLKAQVGSHDAMLGKPVVLAIDDDPLALDRVQDELGRGSVAVAQIHGYLTTRTAAPLVSS